VERLVVESANRTRELVLALALAKVANHFWLDTFAESANDVYLNLGKRWVVASWCAMPSVLPNVTNQVVAT
jgi:hypothetical protein